MGLEDEKTKPRVTSGPSIKLNVDGSPSPKPATAPDKAATEVAAKVKKVFRPVKKTVDLGHPHDNPDDQATAQIEQTSPLGRTSPINLDQMGQTDVVRVDMGPVLPFTAPEKPQATAGQAENELLAAKPIEAPPAPKVAPIAQASPKPPSPEETEPLSRQPQSSAVPLTKEDLDFLQTPRGQAVLALYPRYAALYEAAHDELGTAEEEFQDRLHRANKCHLENDKTGESMYSIGKIAEFISNITLAQIKAAVKELGLPKQKEAELYQRLPLSILPEHDLDEGEETFAAFSTDQPIPKIFPEGKNESPMNEGANTDFRCKIARALLKARLLQLAVSGSYEENFEFLWHYAKSMNPETITFDDGQDPGYELTYRLASVTMDHVIFFKPIIEGDKSFFAEYLALTENNGNNEGIKGMIDFSSKTGASVKTRVDPGFTSMLVNGDEDVKGIISHRQFLSEPETKKDVAQNVIRVDSAEHGANLLNHQRATAVRHLAHLKDLLDKANLEIHNADTEIRQEKHRADTAVRATKEANTAWRNSILQTLHQLYSLTGFWSGKIAKAIKEKLVELGVDVSKM